MYSFYLIKRYLVLILNVYSKLITIDNITIDENIVIIYFKKFDTINNVYHTNDIKVYKYDIDDYIQDYRNKILYGLLN